MLLISFRLIKAAECKIQLDKPGHLPLPTPNKPDAETLASNFLMEKKNQQTNKQQKPSEHVLTRN